MEIGIVIAIVAVVTVIIGLAQAIGNYRTCSSDW